MKSALCVAALLVSTAALGACSSDDPTPSPASDAGGGGTPDSGAKADSGSTAVDAGSDAAAVINSCTTFVDHTATADARSIAWNFDVYKSPDHCMTIKVGQTVTWTTDTGSGFDVHPLKGGSGASPNPIDAVGADGKVTFTAAGTYGYHCDIHPAMIGAVRVIP